MQQLVITLLFLSIVFQGFLLADSYCSNPNSEPQAMCSWFEAWPDTMHLQKIFRILVNFAVGSCKIVNENFGCNSNIIFQIIYIIYIMHIKCIMCKRCVVTVQVNYFSNHKSSWMRPKLIYIFVKQTNKSYYKKLDVCVYICLWVSPSALSPSVIFRLSVT